MQKLQQEKVRQVFNDVKNRRNVWLPALDVKIPVLCALVFMGCGIAGMLVPRDNKGPSISTDTGHRARPEQVMAPAQLLAVSTVVRPPAYTGLPVTKALSADVSALEGSQLSWIFEFSRSDGRYTVNLGSGQTIDLVPLDSSAFELELTASSTSLYQIIHHSAAGQHNVGAVHTITVERDQKPAIRVIEPVRV